MVLVLFRLRVLEPRAPFLTPFYPAVPLLFLGVYLVLLAGALWQQPYQTAVAIGVLVAAFVVAWITTD